MCACVLCVCVYLRECVYETGLMCVCVLYAIEGDSIIPMQLGQYFTTLDNDNDNSVDNCAVVFHGAWWYNSCHESNLNGGYIQGGVHTSYADGVEWTTWTGNYYSMWFTEMKIRPF